MNNFHGFFSSKNVKIDFAAQFERVKFTNFDRPVKILNTLRITNLFNLGKTHFLYGITQQLCLDHNEVIDNEFEKDHYYVTDSDTSLTTPKDVFDKEEVDDDEDKSSSQETRTKIISRLPARGSSIILFAKKILFETKDFNQQSSSSAHARAR